MQTVALTNNKYYCTRAQFNARKTAGTLEVGAEYYITDDEFQSKTLIGTSAPTTSTSGDVGQFYLNTTNNNLYICTAISGSTYTWTLTTTTVDQTYSASSTNAQSGVAVASAISGKQDTITTSNKLSADLITDGTTNIIPTTTDETNWNNKVDSSAIVQTIGTSTTDIMSQNAVTTELSNKADSSSLTSHTSNTSNPHSVTASQVGLDSVVNTGDSDTPVSGGTTKFTTGGAYTELAKKENLGKITIGGTEYTVRVSTTDAGEAGYITFVIEE